MVLSLNKILFSLINFNIKPCYFLPELQYLAEIVIGRADILCIIQLVEFADLDLKAFDFLPIYFDSFLSV